VAVVDKQTRGPLYLGLAAIVMGGLTALAALTHGHARHAFVGIILGAVLVAGAWLLLDFPVLRIRRRRNGTGPPVTFHYRLSDGSWRCILDHRGATLPVVQYRLHHIGAPPGTAVTTSAATSADAESECVVSVLDGTRGVHVTWIATRAGEIEEVAEDRVPLWRDRLPERFRIRPPWRPHQVP
jgi:hypothetical protein